MKRSLALLAAAMLWASTSHAFGVDITWNDCVNGTAGTAATNMFFQCAGSTNINYTLDLEYNSPMTLPSFVAATYYLELKNFYEAPTALKPFWHYENGGCNQNGVTAIGAVPASCSQGGYVSPFGEDGTEGNAVHVLAAYQADFQQPGRGRFVLLSARGDGVPLAAGVNYFGQRVTLSNRNRATCEGCTEGKGLFFMLARLESNDGSPAVDLSGVNKRNDYVCINTTFCIPPDAVTSVSWGRLKGMFR